MVVTVGRFSWQQVMIDLEGTITPTDIDGYTYIFTYTCCLNRGSLLELTKHLRSSEVRRVIEKCMFRSLTVPQLFGHDRGTELTNADNDDMDALRGIVQRLGSAWRPWEQAPTEREQQETQRSSGTLLKPVFTCAPGEMSTSESSINSFSSLAVTNEARCSRTAGSASRCLRRMFFATSS